MYSKVMKFIGDQGDELLSCWSDGGDQTRAQQEQIDRKDFIWTQKWPQPTSLFVSLFSIEVLNL